MGMGFAPTWLRQVSPSPAASHDHFNHCAWEDVLQLCDISGLGGGMRSTE